MIKGKIRHDLTEIDENGNIKVSTEYINSDGAVLQLGATRYSFSVDGDIASIIEKATKDVQEHVKATMVRTYAKKRNAEELQALKNELAKIPVHELSEATLSQNGKLITIDENGVKGIIDGN